jgi:hypothetical protein
MHAQECEIHVQAHANHVAARDGWNRAMKTSTGSWEDGEDLGGAGRSCGGIKVYKSDLEKIGAEHHYRIENGAIARGVKRLEGAN